MPSGHRARQLAGLAVAGALVVVTSACGQTQGMPAAATPLTERSPTTAAEPVTPPPPSTAFASAPRSSVVPTQPAQPRSRIVVLDPGHNGGNAAHPTRINELVPAGRGRTKPCNTTGTATAAGYAEHTFTWDVALRAREILASHAVTVVLTRPDDVGVGPCVNERAAVGNRNAADVVVSLHADGATSDGAHGFHVAYSAPPLNPAQGEPSLRLARVIRDSMRASGFALSTYAGSGGLSARDDLAGLNLSERPAVLVECGNMRSAAEAAVLSSAAGRQRYAEAIAAGILTYLG